MRLQVYEVMQWIGIQSMVYSCQQEKADNVDDRMESA